MPIAGEWSSNEPSGTLRNGFLRRQVARLGIVLEAVMVVAAVAKRLVARMPAAAERDHGAAAETVAGPCGVEDPQIVAFQPQGAVLEHRDLGLRHRFLPPGRPAAFGKLRRLPGCPHRPKPSPTG